MSPAGRSRTEAMKMYRLAQTLPDGRVVHSKWTFIKETIDEAVRKGNKHPNPPGSRYKLEDKRALD